MEEVFPDDIEIANKGDAHCKWCKDKIYKGDIRLRERRFDVKFHYVNTYVCRKCIPKYAKGKEKIAKDIYVKMAGFSTLTKELEKRNRKQIKVNDGFRQKEKLVKEIEFNNMREAWNNKMRR